MFIEQIKTEKNEEYFENVNFEGAVKNQQQVIVKVEPDPIGELTGYSRRPSISIPTSIPVISPKISTPGSKILPASNHQSKFCCNVCKKKFVKAKELSKHASEKHNNKKPFCCFSCRFSARKYSEILEHKRLVHIDQFKCENFAQFKRHRAWHKHGKQSRKIGLKWSGGKCPERFASGEDLVAQKVNRKHHNIGDNGS